MLQKWIHRLIASFLMLAPLAFPCLAQTTTPKKRYLCHDHTLKLATGEDREYTPKQGTEAGELRKILAANGFLSRHYPSLQSVTSIATRSGDVLIIGDTHSGVFVGPGSISHYLGSRLENARELRWTLAELIGYERTYNPVSRETLPNPVRPFANVPVELWRRGSRPPPLPTCESIAFVTPSGPFSIGDRVTLTVTITSDHLDVIDRVSVRPSPTGVKDIVAQDSGEGVWDAVFVIEGPPAGSAAVAYEATGTADEGGVVSCQGQVAFEVVAGPPASTPPEQLRLEIDGPRAVTVGQRATWVLRALEAAGGGSADPSRVGYEFVVDWALDERSRYLDQTRECSVVNAFSQPGTRTIPMVVIDTSTGRRGDAVLELTIEEGRIGLNLSIEGPAQVAADDSPRWTFTIGGGKKPYTLVVSWGDGVEERLPGVGQALSLGHAYQPGRVYTLRAAAEGSRGGVSDWVTLQVAVSPPQDSIRFERDAIAASEGNPTVDVTVIREGSGQGKATVILETKDSSATAGQDYGQTRIPLSWPDLISDPISVSIPIHDDRDVEGDEVFLVELVSPSGARLGTVPRATVKIADNDLPPAEVQRASFVPREYRVGESSGVVWVVVKRLGGTTGTLMVDYTTQDAYAEAGRDYQPSSGTLVWTDGVSSDRGFWVPILPDEEIEREETVHLELSNPRNDVVQVTMDEGVEALILIADDDVEPQPTPTPPRCEALLVSADIDELRPGQTSRLTVTAVFSDGTRQDVTTSPLLTWRGGSGQAISAPSELRFSERIEAVADYNNGECVGRTTLRMEPPSWQPPISHAGDHWERLPAPPPDAYTWYVVCNATSDPCAVNYTDHIDPTRHFVMSEVLPGPRAAEQWIDQHCPSARCTHRGACAVEPVRGGEWRVLCNTRNGEVTLARERIPGSDHAVMAGDLCGEPDARWWVEDHCPAWRCDTSGRCADGPVAGAPGGDLWYVSCYLPSGDVEIGEKPFDTVNQRRMAGPFLGEPDARLWVDQNCPSWLCSPAGCRLADGTDPWGAGRSGGGFVERGQSAGTAESRDTDFVDIGSEEALALLSDDQRAYFESQVRGRGFSQEALDAMTRQFAAELRQQSGQSDPMEGVDEIFRELVGTAIWIATGERPPGVGDGTIGGDTGPVPPGGGVGGGASGGPGWDACVQKFCPICGDDDIVLLGASTDDQCETCKDQKRSLIADCAKGGAAAERPDADYQSFRQYRMETCWTETWDATHKLFRRTYTCHCVGPDRPRPSGKKGCELFSRGEAYTLVECEFGLDSCWAVARQMNFTEQQKRGK